MAGTYAEIKGSRDENLMVKTRTAIVMGLTDDGTGMPAVEDDYAGDVTGVFARKITNVKKTPDVIPGLFVITCQAQNFCAKATYTRAAMSAAAQEIAGSGEEVTSAKAQTAVQMFILDSATHTINLGDYYASETGLHARAVSAIRTTPDVIPGLYLFTVQFTALRART